ncbi:hypothetical protein [Nonomuraea sp. B1E8]
MRPERLIAKGLGLSRNEVLRRVKCAALAVALTRAATSTARYRGER